MGVNLQRKIKSNLTLPVITAWCSYEESLAILKQEEKLNSLSKPKKIEEEYDISFLNIFNKK